MCIRDSGNGISLIIFAGIVSRGKQLVSAIIAYFKLAAQGECCLLYTSRCV